MQETLEKTELREWVVFESGGQRIFGVLHRPTDLKHAPLVVVLHGFASNKCGSNRCYVTLAEKLAKEGIATLRFDFRGSGDSEGSLTSISFDDLVLDAVTVLESLDQLEGVDLSRLALFGSSLGGSIAILAAVHLQLKLRAMALWSPVASGQLWYHEFLTRHPEHIHSDPAKILANYRGIKLHPKFQGQFGRMFACQTLQQLMPLPVLHMHGEKDEMISIRHQEAFRAACSDSCIKYLKYPDAEHALGHSAHFPQVMEESISWFKHYL